MNQQMRAAAMAIPFALCATLLLAVHPSAMGQDKTDSPRWEFKAIFLRSDNETESTKKLNNLAADGWEYVGPLGKGMVAFKRPAGTASVAPVLEGTWIGCSKGEDPKAVDEKEKSRACQIYYEAKQLKLKNPNGTVADAKLVREQGVWKVEITNGWPDDIGLKGRVSNDGKRIDWVEVPSEPERDRGVWVRTHVKEKEQPNSQPKKISKWPGEWLFDGNKDDPCAIFQHGRVLLLVNERGDFATGRIIEPNKLEVKGWDGLVGELVDEGKTISWGNGTKWKRP